MPVNFFPEKCEDGLYRYVFQFTDGIEEDENGFHFIEFTDDLEEEPAFTVTIKENQKGRWKDKELFKQDLEIILRKLQKYPLKTEDYFTPNLCNTTKCAEENSSSSERSQFFRSTQTPNFP